VTLQSPYLGGARGIARSFLRQMGTDLRHESDHTPLTICRAHVCRPPAAHHGTHPPADQRIPIRLSRATSQPSALTCKGRAVVHYLSENIAHGSGGWRARRDWGWASVGTFWGLRCCRCTVRGAGATVEKEERQMMACASQVLESRLALNIAHCDVRDDKVNRKVKLRYKAYRGTAGTPRAPRCFNAM
jgi:hypothetical protein